MVDSTFSSSHLFLGSLIIDGRLVVISDFKIISTEFLIFVRFWWFSYWFLDFFRSFEDSRNHWKNHEIHEIDTKIMTNSTKIRKSVEMISKSQIRINDPRMINQSKHKCKVLISYYLQITTNLKPTATLKISYSWKTLPNCDKCFAVDFVGIYWHIQAKTSHLHFLTIGRS